MKTMLQNKHSGFNLDHSLPLYASQPYFMKRSLLVFALLMVTGSIFSQESGKIISFNAEKVKNAVVITWAPSIQPQTNHFEIQRSADGSQWKVVAIMFPFEDSTVSHTYRYSDKSAPATAHYLIRQIDINKKENFSKVKLVPGVVADK